MKKVYLAGPINGCSDEETFGWRNKAKELLSQFDCLDPTIRDYRGRELEAPAFVVETDKAEIDDSDIVLVGFSKPSVGTSMEVLYAWERNKYVVVCMLEGDVKKMSPWLYYHSHAAFGSLEEACKFISNT